MAKKFFYVCAGIFLLALSYHFGAGSATAQIPDNPIVSDFPSGISVVTANGDVYTSGSGTLAGPYVYVTNVFSGTTQARQSTFGQVKVGNR